MTPSLVLRRTPHRRGAHCVSIGYPGGAGPLSLGVRRRRWAFGQHKVEHTLVGLALCLVAGCGMASAWLGPWGYLLRVPLLLYGLVHACFLGHFLLFLGPVWLTSVIIKRLRGPGRSA